jgi:hypothetical protein
MVQGRICDEGIITLKLCRVILDFCLFRTKANKMLAQRILIVKQLHHPSGMELVVILGEGCGVTAVIYDGQKG